MSPHLQEWNIVRLSHVRTWEGSAVLNRCCGSFHEFVSFVWCYLIQLRQIQFQEAMKSNHIESL